MNSEEAERLVRSLAETRSVEVKTWFDPKSATGKAKLIKGLQALRNYNGGQLVIGFNNENLKPDLYQLENDVRVEFHADVVQELVAKFSSEAFDIEVFYPRLDEQEYVVIAVPSGVRTPVASKSELRGGKETTKLLIRCDDIYFRTLNSNNTVSSARIPYRDLAELMQICFDNREADIGRFLRRHLSDVTPESLSTFFDGLAPVDGRSKDKDDEVIKFIDFGFERFSARSDELDLKLQRHGSFEVGLIINGDVKSHLANQNFLQVLDTHNPSLTGWPIWLNSSTFSDTSSRPYIFEDGWEAMIVSEGSDWFGGYIDFMRKEPAGRFYLRRALQDDVSNTPRAPEPNTELDFGLAVLRTAEAMAVGKAFANALECDPEKTSLEFGFRWSGLAGRRLTSWANPGRSLSMDRVAVQDTVTCRTKVPLFGSPESIAEQTYDVVSRLFNLFDGFEISRSVVDDLVRKLLERRL